jgi:hypothetical protein
MNKPICAISCPVDTYSGYGARARDFVRSIIKLDKYDVKILSQRWGNTRFGYLADHSDKELSSRIVNNLQSKPDIWIQITVPNEFQPMGTYNIGVTAAMETTLCNHTWVDGVNRMDLTLVSSNHSKTSLLNSNFEERTKDNKSIIRSGKIEKPVEVLFEGINPDVYFPNTTTNFSLNNVVESFNFLAVGHWLPGNIGHDRKNIGLTIKSFLETFKNKKNGPGLILKVSKGNTSIIDRESILDDIDKIKKTVKGKLPNIYLVHGDVTDNEMNDLYNHPKVKAMISLTHGEGFGRPLLEFSMVKKPIIAPAWSGQVDFLDSTLALLLPGKLEPVHHTALVKDMILPQAKWFTPDPAKIAQFYKHVFKHYKQQLIKAKQLGNRNREIFNFDSMTNLLDTYFDKYVPNSFASQIELKMPELNLPKLNV